MCLLLAACLASARNAEAAHVPVNSGIDLAGQDSNTKPGDDFYRYANGHWLDRASIPLSRSEASLQADVTEKVITQLHELLDDAAKASTSSHTDDKAKVGAFYTSYMDEERIEASGIEPIAPLIKQVEGVTSRDEMTSLMGRFGFSFEGTLFRLNIDTDIKDSSRQTAYMIQDGLGMPGREYYLSSRFALQKEAYRHYVSKLLQMVGWPHPNKAAADVLRFETKLAQVTLTTSDLNDSLANYNSVPIRGLGTAAPGVNWKRFFASAEVSDAGHVVLERCCAIREMAALYAITPLRTLKAWQATRIVDNASIYLSRMFVQASFGFHQNVLNGVKDQPERWKNAVTAVSGGDCTLGYRSCFGDMRWAVGKLYVERFFTPEAKVRVAAMVKNILESFRERLQHSTWMTVGTRDEALRKLSAYQILVGYPDQFPNYGDLLIDPHDLFHNVLRVAQFDWHTQVAHLNRPTDRREWPITPQTNDANSGTHLDIEFPAALLQPPWFDLSADDAANYGAIGSVIGHELTHGFDDDGRTIDANGNLRDWWTAADAKEFTRRTRDLASQYSAFEILPGVHVNAADSMGENIADLGGLNISLDAYHASLHGSPAPRLEGLSGDQRFFLAWAQSWREKRTTESLLRGSVDDPHPPGRFRVIGPLRNIDDWYNVFDVTPKRAEYLAPRQRVVIW